MAMPVRRSAKTAPVEDPADDAGAAGGAGAQDAGGDAGEDSGQESGSYVVLTVSRNGDGTYTLYQGDEPEDEDEGGEAAGGATGGDQSGAGGETAEQAEGAEGGASAGQEGEQFSSVPELMRGILECIRHDEENGPQASGEDQFDQGFQQEGGQQAA